MSKSPTHFIVTANFTADGSVAYRRADGSWSTQLADAGLFPDEAATAPIVAAVVRGEQRLISDPYPVDVHVGDQGIEATSARERIRATGPTIPLRRPDSGLGRRA